MAFTKTQIANRALVRLGARPVTNVDDDDTDEADTVSNLYDIALECLLSETLWTFATKRVLLSTTTEAIPFSKDQENLTYSYQRPVDVIRIFDTNDSGAYWRVEGDQIRSDTSGLGIIYTYRNEDTATYPAFFVEALSDKLAADLAFPLLNSNTKAREMLDIYQRITLPNAKAENAQVGTPKKLNDDYWLNARFGGPNVQEFS